MKFDITLTWSKIMALLFQSMAFYLDRKYNLQGQVFMYCLPFATFLITGKQAIDFLRAWKGQNGNEEQK